MRIVKIDWYMNLDYTTKQNVCYHVLLGKIHQSEFKAIIMSFNRKNRNPKKFDFTSKKSFF